MTVAEAPVRQRPPSAARAVPLSAARLLRLELRRNAMPWVLPLIAALFWFDSYRPSATLPPLWNLRTFYNLGEAHALVDFGPFVAGVAAWMGSRDGRRGMSDLVTATVRPRWAAQLVTWAATACWAVGAYLVFVGVLFVVYARSIGWGGPPWWPVAVGAAGVAAVSAFGFAVGAYFPSRFAAPVAAFGAFLGLVMASNIGFQSFSGWAMILPSNSNNVYGQDSGIFYPYQPDLQIARLMFLAGLTVALMGLVGLPVTAGGPRLRRTAAAVTAAGLVAAGTAVGLTWTARVGPYGTVIPALHDAASDRPIPYTPVCGQAGIRVCLHPAYRQYLPDVTSALRPVLREVTGLPGTPVRAVQIATTFAPGRFGSGQFATINGSPPVLRVPLNALTLPGSFGMNTAEFTDLVRLEFAHAFVNAGVGFGGPAQQAVQVGMLEAAGVSPAALVHAMNYSPWAVGPGPGATLSPRLTAAAGRFAALSAAARHAWLAAHLGALRSGHLTLAQLP